MFLSVKIEEADNGLIVRWADPAGLAERYKLFLDAAPDKNGDLRPAQWALADWLRDLIQEKRIAEQIKKEGQHG